MIHAIPNPTRKVTLSYPIDQVKQAVKDIPLKHTRYLQQEGNDAIGMYTFSALEFLSLGVFVDINLSEVSETKTELALEIRRAIGSFDEQYEVSKAGRHINRILTAVGDFLENPELGAQLKREKEEKEAEMARKAEENKMTPSDKKRAVLIGLLVGVVAIAIMIASGMFSDEDDTTPQKSYTSISKTSLASTTPVVKKEVKPIVEKTTYGTADQEMVIYTHYKNGVSLEAAKRNITSHWSQYKITTKQIEDYYNNQK